MEPGGTVRRSPWARSLVVFTALLVGGGASVIAPSSPIAGAATATPARPSAGGVDITPQPLHFRSVNLEDGWHSANATTHAGDPKISRDASGITHLIGSIQAGYQNLPAFVLAAADAPLHHSWLVTWGQEASGQGPVWLEIDQRGESTESGGNAMLLTGVTLRSASSKLTFKRLSLLNGWTSEDSAYQTGDPSAAVDPSGIVHFDGAMFNGTGTAFVLPQAMRPSHKVFVPVYVSTDEVGSLEIDSSGHVTPHDTSGGSSAREFTSLAGVTFVAGSSTLPVKHPALRAGWASGQANFGTGNPALVVDAYDVVHLEGSLTASGTPSPVAFRIPTALRPAHVVHLLANGAGNEPVEVTVKPTGGVAVSGATARTLTSLDGLQFPVGQ